MGLGQLAEKALHESEHERLHARALIQRILFLEGKPNLAKREALDVGKDVSAMLKADLSVEYKVVGELKKAMAACEKPRITLPATCSASSLKIPRWTMPTTSKSNSS